MLFNEAQVKVKTTLPTLPLAKRERIQTDRLVLRPFSPDDLLGFHALRTQPEVMIYMPIGRPDKDIEETRSILNFHLPPHDVMTFSFAVLLASTGEFIGEAGIYGIKSRTSWPYLGYKIRSEYWGKGYATEAGKAVMEAWWKLPRSEAEVETDAVTPDDGAEQTECIFSLVEGTNSRSSAVLTKLGFKRYKEWQEPDSREGFGGQPVTLIGFIVECPVAKFY
jgi:RimJ/RimL family protein N-acetyltransferase